MSLVDDSAMIEVMLDSEGDVDLRLEGYNVVASSHVLSLASPVLRKMFAGPFREGAQLRENRAERPVVSFPEDDAAAFLLFCKIAHHRADEIQRNPTPHVLEQLAVLCDKYGCAGAVVGWGALWLHKSVKGRPLEDLVRRLLLAYVLDLREAFSAISQEILLYHTESVSCLPVLGDYPFIPPDLSCKPFLPDVRPVAKDV